MKKFGSDRGLLLVYMQLGQVKETDFHQWYDTEHVPIRIERFEQFTSAVRYSVRGSEADTTAGESDTVPTEVNKKGGKEGSRWAAAYAISNLSVFEDKAYTSLRTSRSSRETELMSRLASVDRRIYRLESVEFEESDSTNNSGNGSGSEPELPEQVPRFAVLSATDVERKIGWRRSRKLTLLDRVVTGTSSEALETVWLHEFDVDPLIDGVMSVWRAFVPLAAVAAAST